MKTQLIYIVLTAVLGFSTLNVSAEGLKGKKKIATKKVTNVSELVQTVKEAELEFESWMLTLSEFNAKSESFVEEPLQMEAWMMDDFGADLSNEDFQDEELILESWMLESFDSKNQEIFMEDEMQLEPWMMEKF